MDLNLDDITYIIMGLCLISFLLFIIRLVLANTLYDIAEWIFLAMFIVLFIATVFIEERSFKQKKARLMGLYQIH